MKPYTLICLTYKSADELSHVKGFRRRSQLGTTRFLSPGFKSNTGLLTGKNKKDIQVVLFIASGSVIHVSVVQRGTAKQQHRLKNTKWAHNVETTLIECR